MEVRLSSRLTSSQKQRHVDELLSSISKKLATVRPGVSQLAFKDIIKRGYFTFAHTTYILARHPGRGIKRSGRTWYLGEKSSIDNLEKRFVQLLIEEFTPFIEERVSQINATSFNFTYGKVDVKLVHSKWGHCSYKNDLLFNINII